MHGILGGGGGKRLKNPEKSFIALLRNSPILMPTSHQNARYNLLNAWENRIQGQLILVCFFCLQGQLIYSKLFSITQPYLAFLWRHMSETYVTMPVYNMYVDIQLQIILCNSFTCSCPYVDLNKSFVHIYKCISQVCCNIFKDHETKTSRQ